MGSPTFAVPILEALIEHHEVVGVLTQPDKPAGRGRKLKAPPVKEIALKHDIPVFQPHSARSEEAIVWLRERNPLVIVVAAYGQILPPEVLALPPHGCLNVHASLLPRHRGAAPVAAAILAGDRETGVTIMLMDEGLDTGPILAQRSCPIGPDETTASLSEKLSHLGAELLLEVLPKWVCGEIRPRPQQGEATYARLLRKKDGLIDWTLPAWEIERRVRAYNPWPSAYTYWDGKLLKIWRAAVATTTTPERRPGLVIKVDGEIGVVCGEGVLLLKEVQLQGKRAMPAIAFSRGHRNFVGSVLSN